MSTDRPDLRDLIDFPSRFVFRAMVEADDTVVARCTAAVAGALGDIPVEVEQAPSSKGNYLAVRVKATVASPEEITAAYAALKDVRGVRLVL